MATPSSFALRMKIVAGDIKNGAARVQREVTTTILQSVTLATPVGNPVLWKEPGKADKNYVGGTARRNWLIGVGAAREDILADNKEEDGESLIAHATPGKELHITNNLPYIVPLNEGHSHQAPIGFVEQAVAEGVAAVKGAKILP